MIGVVFYIIVSINFSAPRRKEYLLQLTVTGSKHESSTMDKSLQRYCSKVNLVNVKAVGEEGLDTLQLSYYIRLRTENNSPNMIREIKSLDGVKFANLFFDEE
jgi:hypothetical protein